MLCKSLAARPLRPNRQRIKNKMISSRASSSADYLTRSTAVVTRHAISEAESTANNHERIMRMARRSSRAPRRPEMKLLRAAVARTFPLMPNVDTRENLFVSMFPETLSRANLGDLDVATGWVLDKIEGVAANAWALWSALYPPTVGKDALTGAVTIKLAEEPPAYIGADSGGDELRGRADTLMLVFRDGEVLCFDNCPLLPLMMRPNDGRTGLDGELCVRRRALNDDEKARFIAATRDDAEFGASYLEPQDASELSDVLYDLCYMAHDIMLADNKKQTLSTYQRKQEAIASAPYSERLAKMCERMQVRAPTEKLLVQRKPATTAETAALSASNGNGGGPAPTTERAASAEYTKAALELEFFRRRVLAQPAPYLSPILLLPKQPHRMSTVRYAFTTKMRRTVGVRTDGLIFVGEDQPFAPVFIDADGAIVNPSAHSARPSALKKYKPRLANSFDAKLVRNADTGAYELYACDRDTPVPSAGLWYGESEEEVERTAALGREAVVINQAQADAALFRPEARVNDRSIWHSVICECNPYLSPAAERAIAAVPPPSSKEDVERYVAAVGVHIRWQPVLERTKKRRANTYVNFCGIVQAIGLFASREEICAHVKATNEARRAAAAADYIATLAVATDMLGGPSNLAGDTWKPLAENQ